MERSSRKKGLWWAAGGRDLPSGPARRIAKGTPDPGCLCVCGISPHARHAKPLWPSRAALLDESGAGHLVEKAFIVSNGMLSKPEIERQEIAHGIRVSAVLHCEPTSKVPDLREWL